MRKRCSSDQRAPDQSFLEHPTSTLLLSLKRREQKRQCSGLQIEKAASSFYYLTRTDGTVYTAGPHSMRSNRVWPAGFVFKRDHNLLSHLCFDYGTCASEDKEISSFLVSTNNKILKVKLNCTQNSQVLLAGLLFLLHAEAVVGVFSIHNLLVTRANPVISFP